jgi:hypothetical protein
MTTGITFTRIIETNVFGAIAYHFECDCGLVSRRWDREATAVKNAKKHAAIHGEVAAATREP